MKDIKRIFGFIVLSLALLATGCATGGGASEGEEGSQDMTLRQHLERKSGVTVQGYEENIRVELRGENPRNKQYQQPLFVVDGDKWGRNFYRVASALSGEPIESVEVLPSPARYGGQGGAGVIEITTAKGS